MASVLTTTLPSQTATHSSFNILDDRRLGLGSFEDSDGDSSTTTTPDRNPAGLAHIRALQETCVNVAQNAKSGPGHLLFSQPTELANTSLTLNLEKLRISELAPEEKRPNLQDDCKPEHPALARKLPARPAIGFETFHPPGDEDQIASPSLGGTILEVAGSEVGTCACDSLEPIIEGAPLEGRKSNEVDWIFGDHPLMHLPSNFANIEEQADKTQAGQYELHLTYPATLQPDPNLQPDENRHPALTDETEIAYGCNYVRRNAISKAALRRGRHIADTVVLIASPLGDEVGLQEEPKVLVDQMNPVAASAGEHLAPTTPLKAQDASGDVNTTPASAATPNALAKSPVPSPAAKLVHIEDSFEALDKLEEELEAVNAVAHFKRVESPERKSSPRTPNLGSKTQQLGRTGSARRPRSNLYPATVRVKSSDPVRTAARRSRSMSVDTEDRKDSPSANGSPTISQSDSPARRPASKPASLAAPKPLAKSTKPRTVPAFELPGEAVARRLKEQREARLSAQTEPEKTPQAARTSFPQRSRSTRVLPKPTFELPGEAISRRKREEREAKLRAQEEEERKRREFKARPIKGSLNQPTTLPRETVASRARLNKAAEDTAGVTSKAGPGKRASLAPPATLSASPQSRGRTVASSQVSRTASLSAASSVSKRSTVSSEGSTPKFNGKEIFERDSKLITAREKERAEREMLAKKARDEAAERSRQASREWAEKQRRKARASMAGASSTG